MCFLFVVINPNHALNHMVVVGYLALDLV